MNPLLLLDVDGVLNALGHDEALHGAWPSWARGSARADGRSWPITWAPAVVDRLRTWHGNGVVELQWLTTWGDDANDGLRELLGLPELVVAGTYADGGAGAATAGAATSHAAAAPAAPDPLSGHWWKYDVVRRLLVAQPQRRLIWVDDELYEAASRFRQWADDQDRVTAIGPDPRTGLTPRDLDAIKSAT